LNIPSCAQPSPRPSSRTGWGPRKPERLPSRAESPRLQQLSPTGDGGITQTALEDNREAGKDESEEHVGRHAEGKRLQQRTGVGQRRGKEDARERKPSHRERTISSPEELVERFANRADSDKFAGAPARRTLGVGGVEVGVRHDQPAESHLLRLTDA